MSAPSRLEHFPISFFAIVMGLSGLTLAWDKAATTLDQPMIVGQVLLAMVVLVFAAITLLYLAKMLRFAPAVRAELRHPVKLSFFPAFSISLILLATCTLHLDNRLALALWGAGALIHLGFTLYVMNAWMHHEHFQIQHINPAWFIPVVGNILVPIAGVPLGYAELSWFFFSIGLVFWLVLLTIIFYRMIFHQPLPQRLVPTLFILIAPPAVGFIAYVRLTGGLDAFAHILYYTGLFLTLLLTTQIRRFTRLQFFLSWWAYTFPLGAITVATLRMYELTGTGWLGGLGYLLLGIVTLIVAGLVVRTLIAVGHGEICVEES